MTVRGAGRRGQLSGRDSDREHWRSERETRTALLRRDPSWRRWLALGAVAGLEFLVKPTFTLIGFGLAAVVLLRLRFEILDAQGAVLRSREVRSQDLNDLHYSDFPFSPIPDSKNRLLHVRLRVLEAKPAAPVALATGHDGLNGGSLSVNDNSIPDALLLRTYYGTSIPGGRALALLAARASQFKPPWLKVPWLWGWMAVAIVATLAALASVACLMALEASATPPGGSRSASEPARRSP